MAWCGGLRVDHGQKHDPGDEILVLRDLTNKGPLQKHYRSYRASDNTYQPYSGARRQCLPLLTAFPPNSVASEGPQHLSSVARARFSSDEHARWCFSRYRSYNPDNNTYRAFTGEIRACASPYI